MSLSVGCHSTNSSRRSLRTFSCVGNGMLFDDAEIQPAAVIQPPRRRRGSIRRGCRGTASFPNSAAAGGGNGTARPCRVADNSNASLEIVDVLRRSRLYRRGRRRCLGRNSLQVGVLVGGQRRRRGDQARPAARNGCQRITPAAIWAGNRADTKSPECPETSDRRTAPS